MSQIYINLKKFKKKINLGFFTSNGGVSKGNNFSLNCSINKEDNKTNIKKNINIAKKSLSIKEKKLKLISQIHSNKIYFINNKNLKKKLNGDGLITTERNIALAVLTADCAPIFIFDLDNNIICCLHSGWKGALSNIVKQCIDKLKAKKIKIKKVVAIVGPCLGCTNFEVDKNFKFKFTNKKENYSQFFKSKNKNKDLFDLRKLINFQLKKEGISNIYNINSDTYKNKDMFFSHRRSIHENKVNTGRMINIISFKD